MDGAIHDREEMMAPLGYHGTISARDDRVQAVMDALHDIDGGVGLGTPAHVLGYTAI